MDNSGLEKMTVEELMDEYYARAHAMQAGVAMEAGGQDQTPKHLRVGVNSAMVEHAALVNLLIDKGIIAREEYLRELVKTMGEEVDRYAERIGKKTGVEITLV